MFYIRYKFPPHIYQYLGKEILTERGKKKVGSVTSAEREELIALISTVNATGNSDCVRFSTSPVLGSFQQRGTHQINPMLKKVSMDKERCLYTQPRTLHQPTNG